METSIKEGQEARYPKELSTELKSSFKSAKYYFFQYNRCDLYFQIIAQSDRSNGMKTNIKEGQEARYPKELSTELL